MLLALSLLAASGCGSEAKVSGKVTLDGQPLESGTIMFVPADGKGQPQSGEIKNGQYSVNVEPGSKIVQITSSKVVGQKPRYENSPNSPIDDISEQIVADEYNTKSTLKANVKAGSSELPPFEVKPKKK